MPEGPANLSSEVKESTSEFAPEAVFTTATCALVARHRIRLEEQVVISLEVDSYNPGVLSAMVRIPNGHRQGCKQRAKRRAQERERERRRGRSG